MTTAVTKFDPAAYVDKLREKIKTAMVDVIPEEQWNAMIKAEIGAFFEKPLDSQGYHGNWVVNPRSKFTDAVYAALSTETSARLKVMFDSPEWRRHWDGQRNEAGQKVGELLEKHGATILNNWLAAAMQNAIDVMRPRGM